MELKIFKPGFDVEEFNQFIDKNITVKIHYLNDGTIYVLWKPIGMVGLTKIGKIEGLDQMICEKEKMLLVHQADKENTEAKIADMSEELKKYNTNDREYKDLEKQITDAGIQIKMADSSIKGLEREVTGFRLFLQKVQNEK